MEYIEPAPKQVKPHAKRNKIILASIISAVCVGAITATYVLTINNIFIEYENIGLFTYSYRYDIEGSGVRIDSIKDDVKLPSKFRIPNKLGGRPVVEIADEVFSTQDDIVEMIFPDTLEKIGTNCFKDCVNLEKFNIPSKLSVIGTDAFEGTKWLEDQEDGEVAVGNMLYTYKGEMEPNSAIVESEDSPAVDLYSGTIVNLGKYINMSSGVFKDQMNLRYAELPERFTSIYESTFEDCYNLETVKLHDSLTEIGNYAFSGCSSLYDVSIPTSVESIGSLAFAYTKLTGELSLHENLSYLGTGVFKGCKDISKVTIPRGFSYISDNLFEDCSSLSDVEFSEEEYSLDSKMSYIGENAFKGTNLNEFNVPFNVSSIKKNAFASCPNLESITLFDNVSGARENVTVYNEETNTYSWEKSTSSYQGLLKFETGVFRDSPKFKAIVLVDENSTVKSSLDEVALPTTISSLGGSNNDAYFFTGTSITTLNLGKDLSAISDEAYKEYLKSTEITTLPPSICEGATKLAHVYFGGENNTVEVINRAAFKDCTSLVSIEIADDVRTIETNVFEGCSSLKSVTLPTSCSSITTKTFANCTSLESITIPENYKTIGQEAFSGCISLASVNLGANPTLTNIGQAAFSGCTSLASFSIPNSCNAIATSIFKGCSSLASVTLSSNTTLKEVKASMFEDSGIQSIVIPSNYTSIGEKAFANSSLENITLEASKVVSLGKDAFLGDSLVSISVPSDLVESYKADASWANYASLIKAI